MRAKTMEGLMGAGINKELQRTPMRVFKEARRKGDTDAMKRAMGYVGDYEKRAGEYQEKTKEGMKEDTKDAREEAKIARERGIEKRGEEKEKQEERIEKQEERIEKQREANAVSLELSAEGKALAKNAAVSGNKVELVEAERGDGRNVETVKVQTVKTQASNIDAAKVAALYTGTNGSPRRDRAAVSRSSYEGMRKSTAVTAIFIAVLICFAQSIG